MKSRVPFLGFRLALASVLFAVAMPAAETVGTNAVSSATSAQPASITETAQMEWLKSYVELREELYGAQLARVRAEAEAEARMQATAYAEKIEQLRAWWEAERALQREDWRKAEESREQERRAAAHNTRLAWWLAGIIGVTGFFSLAMLSFWQWRGIKRVAELASNRGLLASPGLRESALDLPVPSDHAVTESTQRLLGTIERLERRIHELEDVSHAEPARILPAETTQTSASEHAAPKPVVETRAEEIPPAAGPEEEGVVARLLGRGRLLIEAKRPKEAAACYDEILSKHPHHAEALVRKGIALEQLKRDEEALRCYDEAIRADPKKTLAYLCKGAVCERLNRHDESAASYRLALRTDG